MRKDDGNDQDTMTMRDRFAMAALTALLSCDYDRPLEFDVEAAYETADAMLAARAKAMPVRTAEEERADVVAALRSWSEARRARAEAETSMVEKLDWYAGEAALEWAARQVEGGAHVGAAERAKAGAK